MRRTEYIELACIVAAVVAVAFVAARLPAALGTDRLVLFASALLLGQSLVRDVVLLLAARLHLAEPSGPQRRARCMCLESTVGASGVVAGLGLALAGSTQPVALAATAWPVATAAVLVVGFLLKDLVLVWWPLRIRRDPDHMNIIVTLRP